MTHIMLVGNPNCGKTTLFNALTGEHQRVGHWPGVTVEKKTGLFSIDNHSIQLTDLPGTYAISLNSDVSQDAQISTQQIIWGSADLFVNVLDACHLERHLYLTSQLLELDKPVIVALNMIDIAHQQGIAIDIAALSQRLGCPVVEIQANCGIGLDQLRHLIIRNSEVKSDLHIPTPSNSNRLTIQLSSMLQSRLCTIEAELENLFSKLTAEHKSPSSLEHNNLSILWTKHLLSFLARRLLEEGSQNLSISMVMPDGSALSSLSLELPAIENHDLDILMADARYAAIHHVASNVQKKDSDVATHWTARFDRVILHRFFAIPIFLTLLYGVFFLAINVGGAFQTFF